LLVFVDVTGRQKVFCCTGLVGLGKTSNKKDARRTNDQSRRKEEKDKF